MSSSDILGIPVGNEVDVIYIGARLAPVYGDGDECNYRVIVKENIHHTVDT